MEEADLLVCDNKTLQNQSPLIHELKMLMRQLGLHSNGILLLQCLLIQIF